MFADIHFIDFLRANPALAVFVTLALGFLVGKLRWRSFSLGTVTSVLLVGVVVGQLKIEIPEPAKPPLFSSFSFRSATPAGPQFFRGAQTRRAAAGGVRGGRLSVVPRVDVALRHADGLRRSAGGRTVGRFADHVRRAGRGDRHHPPAARRTGDRSGRHARLLCRDLYFRYGGVGVDLGNARPASAGRGGEGTQGGARPRIEAGRDVSFTAASILRRVPSSSALTRPKTTGSGSGTPSPNSNATCSRRRN